MSKGVKIGIAIAVILLIAGLVYWFVIRKKEDEAREDGGEDLLPEGGDGSPVADDDEKQKCRALLAAIGGKGRVTTQQAAEIAKCRNTLGIKVGVSTVEVSQAIKASQGRG